MNDALNELALYGPCLYCQANAGQWCFTKTGKRSTFLHTDRTDAVRMAYTIGHDVGYQEAVNAAIEQPDTWARWVAREQRRRRVPVA